MTRHRRTIAQAVLSVYVLNPLVVTAQAIIHAGEGKLYNSGSVILTGTAQGDVDNLSSGQVARTGSPNQGDLAGSYKLSAPVFDLGKDTVVVGQELLGYNDVQNRAFFQSAGLTGHLRNIASDVVGGVSTYEPISVVQGSTWLVSYKQTALAPNQDPATFDPNAVFTTTVVVAPTANPTPSTGTGTGTAQSLARLYLPKPASITLVGPKPGTIVGQTVSISGGDLVLDNSSQAGTNTAGNAAVKPGAAQTVDPAASTTVQVTAQNTALQAVQGMQPVVSTPGHGAWVGPVSFAVPGAAPLTSEHLSAR